VRWRNTEHSYGLVAVAFHWLTALVVPGLFVLGLWMVDLTYYDPWYRRAPAIHKALGVLLFLAVLLRLAWRLANPLPAANLAHAPWERRLAALTHRLLYLLLIAVMLAGYLISTADGRDVDVFGLFSVPATLSGLENQEDIAGDVHLALAITLLSAAGLHALAALKHHFLDRDRTLLRMFGRGTNGEQPKGTKPATSTPETPGRTR
jgi:cytochrome b561